MDEPALFSTFGHWLKTVRQQAYWTQTELARRLGYEVSLIRKIEAGRRQPSADFRQRLTDLLGLVLPDPAVLTQAHILLPLHEIPAPAPLFAGSYLPLRANPLFTGRNELLFQLALAFTTRPTAQKTICLGQRVATTGLGGIGKTQLAVEFAHRYGRFFPGGVFWLNFAEPAGIPGEIARCGRAAHLNLSPDFDQLSQEQQVALVQRAWQENIPRLLIFDNCEEETLLETWRPTTGGCHVLITSRCQDWDLSLGVVHLMLEVLPRPESIHFLCHFLPALTEPDADALAEALGDLPLALHLAGNYLAQGDETPQVYLQHLQTQGRLQHLSLQTGRLSPTRHTNHLAGTFALSLRRLDTPEPQAQLALALLRRAVCFAPGQPIPLSLLAETLPAPDTLDQALTRLVKLGLVTLGENQTLRVHQLVAEFVQTWQGEQEIPESQEKALTAVAETLIQQTEKCNATRSLYPARDWQVHLRHVTESYLSRADRQSIPLCQTLGWHLWTCSDYQEARNYLEKALGIQREYLDHKDPDLAITLEKLGRSWYGLNQWDNALVCHLEALQIRQNFYGEYHSLVAQSHNSLGLTYQIQSENSEARLHLETAIVIYRKTLGDSHPDTGFSYMTLALQLQQEGELDQAIEFINRALNISRKHFGEDHPDTARLIHILGMFHQRLCSYQLARHYYELAFEKRERLLGKEHNDTLTTLGNLGGLLREMGHFTEAQKILEECLAIREKKFGAHHYSVAQNLHNLCTLWLEMKAYDKLNPLMAHTLNRYLTIFGTNHTSTAFALLSMGLFQQHLGNWEQASEHFRKSLNIRQEKFGELHGETITTVNCLGNLYLDMEQYSEASISLTYAHQCLQKSKVFYPRILAINLHAQGRLHEATGILSQARDFYTEALNLRRQYLGDQHPHTQQSLEALERLNSDGKSEGRNLK